MNLDESQRKKVAEWIADGLKISEIQTRLASELGLQLTYMDVRLLVDDLKLTPKDIEPPQPGPSAIQKDLAPAGIPAGPPRATKPTPDQSAAPPTKGGVSVSMDQITRPGAVVSGKVTFGDGNKAEWYFDEAGRLGLVPQVQGYRPSTTELQQFQVALEKELQRMGL